MKQELIDMLLEYYGELMQEKDSVGFYNWHIRDGIVNKMNAIDLLLNTHTKQSCTMEYILKSLKKPKKD
jgi:hypothetical protein